MSTPPEIPEGLDQAADEVPEELSALLLEAADTIRMLRELVAPKDETWLDRTGQRGKPEEACVHFR